MNAADASLVATKKRRKGSDPRGVGKANGTTASDTREGKMVWTCELICALLELRCEDYGAAFELHRSAAQLSIYWGKIALALNNKFGTSMQSSSPKNKYASLKREYSSIRLDERSTGNSKAIQYPLYWDAAVAAFGDKHGLGHHDYATRTGAQEAEGEGDSDSEDAPTASRQDAIDAEVQRQRAKRPKKHDIGQSLVALGDSLYRGMSEMARMGQRADNDGRFKDQENDTLHAVILQLQSAVQQNTVVQGEILKFLKRE